jgi:Zn-dependent protease
MFLGEPAPSNADLHFRLFGFPVRVHPFFWLVMLVFGLSGERPDPFRALIWTGVGFVSILVHELGHAFFQRRFGGDPRIVLYSFGGLAICDDCDRSPAKQILIALAGPFAGFAFAVLAALVIRGSGHPLGVTTQAEFGYYVPLVFGELYFAPFDSFALNNIVWTLFYVNIWWGLLNLLPIYPLDGGRVARETFTLRGDPRRGIVASLWLSIATAAAVAVLAAFGKQNFTVIFFALMAFSNYQALQSYRHRGYGEGW